MWGVWKHYYRTPLIHVRLVFRAVSSVRTTGYNFLLDSHYPYAFYMSQLSSSSVLWPQLFPWNVQTLDMLHKVSQASCYFFPFRKRVLIFWSCQYVNPTASRNTKTDQLWTGKDLGGSSHALMGALSRNLLEETYEKHENSISCPSWDSN